MGAEGEWYANLIKPTWAPPEWLFGPVWTVLYIIIAVSFVAVCIRFWQGRIGLGLLIPFLLNLGFNLAFSPIQFGLRNNWLAAADILLVWGTLVWALSRISPIMPWVAYVNIPYFLWVSFALVLQFTITWLNR
ncbi:MAG: TspO/MBR family protein [Candidatus Moraniibacteriota bacterium]|nr:MAG: tryptophan-rich sensory protein [Candidatus Moranbacteria bacterium]